VHCPDTAEGIAAKSCVASPGVSFSPKGMLLRVKNRIGKEHWVSENVIQYKKDSMYFIQEIVSDALKEEEMEIYQFLSYLNKTR